MTAAQARSADLRDGRVVLVRPIGPDDKALVADAFKKGTLNPVIAPDRVWQH